mgnify:CR=1 FL=1
MQPIPYWRLSSFYLFYFALLGSTAPFLALYFDHLGFSPARIGELVAIPMLMRCVAPNLWGWLGDRTGQRLLIVRLGALCTLATFALIFFGKSYAWLALVMALHAFFWHAVLPQFEVITLAHLHGQTSRYSQVRLWGSIGFILTVVGLGRLFEWLSLDIYPVALVTIMAGIVAASLWVPNAQPVEQGGRSGTGGFLQQLRAPGVIAFYACVALMQLSHGPYYTFLTLHLEHLGYTRGAIGLLWALGVVAEVLMFMVMSRLFARFSVQRVLLVSFLLAALRWLLLGNLAQEPAVLIFAQLLHAAQQQPHQQHRLAGLQRGRHQRGQIAVQLLQFRLQPAADLVEIEADVVLVQVVGRTDQLRRRKVAFGQQDAVLHLAGVGHDDEQDAFVRQAQEFDLADARQLAARRDDDAGEAGELRQQLRRLIDQQPRIGRAQFTFQFADLAGLQRLHRQQRVDEEAVAARRRDAAGRGVRAGDVAHVLKVGHDIADGRRRQVEAGVLRQRARTHRLAVGDVALDQGLEQQSRSIFKHGAGGGIRILMRLRRLILEQRRRVGAVSAPILTQPPSHRRAVDDGSGLCGLIRR